MDETKVKSENDNPMNPDQPESEIETNPTPDQHQHEELKQDQHQELEQAYRTALAEFKANKKNKDLRRAKTAAKRAWDDAVAASQDGEPLTCKDCSQMFIFSKREQEFYLENGWMNQPHRCKKCTQDGKARLADRTARDSKTKQMCYAFQKGICGFGDTCRFSHDPKGKKKEMTEKPWEDAKNKDKDKDDAKKKEKKETKEITFVAKCKWGTKCTLKKCRFQHEEGKGDDTEPMEVSKETEATATATATAAIEKPVDMVTDKNGNGKNKLKVAKAMTKVLQKAPSKQMKMKVLRKLVKAKIEEKNLVLGKGELKKVMEETIASTKYTMASEGKVVRLVQ
jgi:hypothetical protein